MKLTEKDFDLSGVFPTDMGTSWAGLVIKLKKRGKYADEVETNAVKDAAKLMREILENQEIIERLREWNSDDLWFMGNIDEDNVLRQVKDKIQSVLGDKK